MKHLVSACLLFLIASAAQALPTHYFGSISGSGNYDGQLDTNFGWINPSFAPNAWGQDINLWGFSGTAGEKLSLDIASNDLLTGFSLYFGEVDSSDLLYGLFNNSGDIGSARYLAGADLWGIGQSLVDFTLSYTGFYTLIVGGKDFGGYNGYEYSMSVARASVPEPAALILFGSGLLGLIAARRRRHAGL